MAKTIYLLTWLFAGQFAVLAQTSADIPVEAFSALPTFKSTQLSPSGEKLAYLTELDGKSWLIVGNIDGSGLSKLSAPGEQIFTGVFWASDNNLIYTTSFSLKRRSHVVRTEETRIYNFSFRDKRTRWLGKPDRIRLAEATSQLEYIVHMLPNNPDSILIALDLNKNKDYETYEVNLKTGFRKARRKEMTGIQDWKADHDSKIRIGYGFYGSNRRAQYKTASGKWIDLLDTSWSSRYTIEGFTNEDDILYVSGLNNHGMRSLYKLDAISGQVTQTLFSQPEIDLNGIVKNPQTGQIVGVSYIDDFQRVKYFDERLVKIQQIIDKALPNAVNTILEPAPERNRYFIFSESARNPGDFYVYDPSKKALSFVARSRPDINTDWTADTKKVLVPTRDGSMIPGYLTVPNDTDTVQKLPTIILPHDGPYGERSDAHWDYRAQFYASRGYLVLKPNYRGSGGYGELFQSAGYNQWSGRMQNDVVDATEWLVKKGYSDPSRICIVGNFYGGYAALMGVIKTPNLFKCAISVNGITDLKRMRDSDRLHVVGGRSWTSHWGMEGKSIAEISPFGLAENITRPVLIIATVDDARTPFQYSVEMHEKLRNLDKDSQYVRIEKGNHNMTTKQSRLTMLRATEKFLDKHIGN